MDILFIGNSHTFFHGMPYQCRELLKWLGIHARVSAVMQPGKSLDWHCGNPATKLALRYCEWDHVIFQQATHPFAGAAALLDGVKRLLAIPAVKPSAWLYNTWCKKSKPADQKEIDEAFQLVSQTLKLPVIPVAKAWHEVERRDPGHDLYHTDGAHAGRAGSYVTALCIARALSGKSVAGLPSSLRTANRFINRVSSSAASLYQCVVDDVMPLA